MAELMKDRVAIILKRYQSRLDGAKRWPSYYSRNVKHKAKRLLAGVRHGRCPKVATIENPISIGPSCKSLA